MEYTCSCCYRPLEVCRAERDRAAETATVEEMCEELARMRTELDELKDLVERMRLRPAIKR